MRAHGHEPSHRSDRACTWASISANVITHRNLRDALQQYVGFSWSRAREGVVSDDLQHHQIREWIDVLAARRAAKLLAREIGFQSRETSELAIVASELGSNI